MRVPVITFVIIVLLCVTIVSISAAPSVKPPDWKNMPILSTGEIVCGEDYVRGEMRDSDPGGPDFLVIFYLKNETNPFVLWDTKTDLVYLDFERDGVFDLSDKPGPTVGTGACEALQIIHARKRA